MSELWHRRCTALWWEHIFRGRGAQDSGRRRRAPISTQGALASLREIELRHSETLLKRQGEMPHQGPLKANMGTGFWQEHDFHLQIKPKHAQNFGGKRVTGACNEFGVRVQQAWRSSVERFFSQQVPGRLQHALGEDSAPFPVPRT